MAFSSSILHPEPESRFAARLREAFQRKGWRIEENDRVADRCADMAVSKIGRRYLLELKTVSEGRRDRLVPVLAQAILQAQAKVKASSKPAIPLAVVAAPRIVSPVLAHLERFLADNAPDVSAGFLDDEGWLQFRGAGLEELNERPAKHARLRRIAVPESGQLFSDLNQWMLKILLAPEIPAEMLAAPRGEYRNATQLAQAADVSLMSAFRFIRQLRQSSPSCPVYWTRKEVEIRRAERISQRSTPSKKSA